MRINARHPQLLRTFKCTTLFGTFVFMTSIVHEKSKVHFLKQRMQNGNIFQKNVMFQMKELSSCHSSNFLILEPNGVYLGNLKIKLFDPTEFRV